MNIRTLALVIGVASIGCRSVERVAILESPPQRYDALTLVMKDGKRVRVYQPQVTGDSLRGFRDTRRSHQYATAVNDIGFAEYSALKEGRSVLLVLGIPVAAAAFFLFLLATSGGPR